MTFLTDQQKFIIAQRGKIEGIQSVYKPYRNESEWLRAKIATLGGTSNGRLVSDLWKQLNSLASLPVSNFVNENKRIYYRNNS